MKRLGIRQALGLLAAAGCWAGTAGAGPLVSAEKDIVDTAVAAGDFKTLATALTAAGLVDTLKGTGPFTVFAPTDAAFAKLPKGTLDTLLKPENKAKLASILTYHVVSGRVPAEQAVKLSNAKTANGQQIDLVVKDGKLTIDGAGVVKADIGCSNGVIHVIDSVILPSDKDVIETAQAAGTFKNLAAAIEAAGLMGALQGDGPFTVFAPTDEAFAKLPKGTLEDLLKPENKEKLASILKFHVAAGRAFAADALKAGDIKTLQGGAVRVKMVDGKPQVNGAGIIKTDIDASNGVIHVIDTVLMPAAEKKTGMRTPQSLIELAIERGAPMFNAGNPDACTAVYEVTANGLLTMDIPSDARTRLASALTDMRNEHDARRQAWILRNALDDVIASL